MHRRIGNACPASINGLTVVHAHPPRRHRRGGTHRDAERNPTFDRAALSAVRVATNPLLLAYSEKELGLSSLMMKKLIVRDVLSR
jgi:hypothetical protein